MGSEVRITEKEGGAFVEAKYNFYVMSTFHRFIKKEIFKSLRIKLKGRICGIINKFKYF